MFSLRSSPILLLESAESWGGVGVAGRLELVRLRVLGWLFVLRVAGSLALEEEEESMSSLRRSATPLLESLVSAWAYFRRMISTAISGAVSMSSTLMIRSKKAILEGRVTMMSWLERSSAIICTLPRIIPRSASLTKASTTELPPLGSSAGCDPGRVTPGRLRLCEMETPFCIPPLSELLVRGAAVDFLLFSSSSREACTNSSSDFLMSAAFACLMP